MAEAKSRVRAGRHSGPALGLTRELPKNQHPGLGSAAIPPALSVHPARWLRPELTTWLKVMTLSRVSLQLFTRPSGKQGSRSFSSVSMCSVVVASLEPGGGGELSFQPTLRSRPRLPALPALRLAPTSRLLNLLDAELGGGNGSRVMGRSLLTKHEFAALDN